jgi:hypothetical protein
MKRFSFPLERVRLWRAGQVALEELKLEHFSEALSKLQQEKQGIQSERASSHRQVLGQSSMQASELESLDVYRLHTRNRIREIENRERQAVQQADAQRQRVIEARRAAELLDRLRRKAMEEWRIASDREQETLATELYLAKRLRRS